jgi:hypothetical protein
MPYQIVKIPFGKYKVMNIETGRVFGTHMSKDKAERQLRLLYRLHDLKVRDEHLPSYSTIE